MPSLMEHSFPRATRLVAVAAAITMAAPASASAQSSQPQTGIPSTYTNWVPSIRVQHFRPRDERGLNMFEPPKDDSLVVTGFSLQWGAAFTQEFQGLHHTNTAAPRVVNGTDLNRLIVIGNGFNNAVANLYVDAQVAPGIRVALSSYLSSRHHEETW